MPGKVRTAMSTIDANIVKIHKALSDGNFVEAKRQWALAKASIIAFDTYAKGMSGKTWSFGKAAKVEAYRVKMEKFKSTFGDSLDQLS